MPPESVIARRRKKAALTERNVDYRQRRQDLLRVAATVFKEKGYDAATLNDIAERFGIDRASLYYYVGSKQDLFREIVKGILDNNVIAADHILALADVGPMEKLQLLVERLIESYEQDYPYPYVYLQEEMKRLADDRTAWASSMKQQLHRFEQAFITQISDAVRQNAFRSDIPVALAASSLFGMLNWTHRWFKPGHKYSAKDVADAFWKIFAEGMQKPTPPGS
jgi:AcrR family transcriptional regulator